MYQHLHETEHLYYLFGSSSKRVMRLCHLVDIIYWYLPLKEKGQVTNSSYQKKWPHYSHLILHFTWIFLLRFLWFKIREIRGTQKQHRSNSTRLYIYNWRSQESCMSSKAGKSSSDDLILNEMLRSGLGLVLPPVTKIVNIILYS